MAIQDMFPDYRTPPINPQGNTRANTGVTLPDLWNFGLGAYDYYKSRDTAGDVAKNLSKGYTAAQGELGRNLGPWAARGNIAADRYMQLADQYPTNALDLPSYADYDPGEFDPSQLRDPEYLASTPGYQFRYEQGRKARENAAASRGLNLSTNILRDLDQFGQDMASQEYEKEYNRLRDQYGLSTGRAKTRYSADTNEMLGEYQAGRQDAQQRMQNYVPLMSAGYGAAGVLGTEGAQLESARGESSAMREQSQGNLQTGFLGDISSGEQGVQGWADQLGISDWSLDDVGNVFGNVRDWFTDPNTSIQGTWDDFWTGVRDFEIGDFSEWLDGFF